MKEKKIVVTDDAKFVDSYITYSLSKLKDRPDHDRRYSIDSSKIHKLGWAPILSQHFNNSMKKTINWYIENEWWWKPSIKGK
jgi:dTDP-D-glucose 4,6-dehydratase